MKASRAEVYRAIDTERDFQHNLWGRSASSGGAGAGERTIDEFILYIHGYAQDLARIGSHEINRTNKLDFVRKVGALCIACMEQHGAPQREKNGQRQQAA